MTPFGALLSLLGLSQRRAAVFLGISEKTVEHFIAGRRRRNGVDVEVTTPDGVIDDLVAAWHAIEVHALAIVAQWNVDRTDSVDVPPLAITSARVEAWSALDAQGIAAGLVIAKLPADVEARIVC